MTLVTIRLGERAAIVAPDPRWRRLAPVAGATAATAIALVLAAALVWETGRRPPPPLPTVSPAETALRSEAEFLRAAHAGATARAAQLEAALAALEVQVAAALAPTVEAVREDAEDTAAAVAELESRSAWLAAALVAETGRRHALEGELVATADRHRTLTVASEALAALLEASVEERLVPVRRLLATVEMEGPALARILAAAPGSGGPLVPVPAAGEDLLHRLPPPAADRVRAAMDAAQALRTLCRLADRIPAGMPVAATGQSSGFGRRIDPFTRQPAHHTGVDLNAPTGTPVTVPAPGRVADVARHPEYGLMVDVDHGFALVTRYAHLSTALVTKGATVAAGNPVGLVGRTGRTTGDHLHYEVQIAGRPVDPANFLTARRHVCEAR